MNYGEHKAIKQLEELIWEHAYKIHVLGLQVIDKRQMDNWRELLAKLYDRNEDYPIMANPLELSPEGFKNSMNYPLTIQSQFRGYVPIDPRG